MSITTYTELQTAVRNRLGGRSDLSDTQIQEFISLGESELNNDLRLRTMETSGTLTLTAAARSIDLPTGYLEDISLRYENNDFYVTRVSLRDLNESVDDDATQPFYYAISDKIYFEAPADQAYTFTLDYFKAFDLATDETNGLLTKHPKTYLYASLVEAAAYSRNGEREAFWQAKRDQAVSKANRLDGRTRRNAKLVTEIGGGVRFNINRGY